MSTVILMQARLGSTRLPCKTLLTLRGLPVIDWLITRCLGARLVDKLVVAIPDTPRDTVLVNHLQGRYDDRVQVFRGSENDVLGRMSGAARSAGATTVLRVCADNPLIWGEELDHLIRFFRATPCDYAYNHIPRNNLYPDGLGAEMLSAELLYELDRTVTDPVHREHCLSHITAHPERYAIRTFDPPHPALHRPDVKLDMDTPEDFIRLALLPIHPDMPPWEVIRLVDATRQGESHG